MAAMLETPSRIWRRIEAVEDQDIPSLPSLPAFEDSADVEPLTSRVLPQESDENTDDDSDGLRSSSPVHSTPAASQYASTIRPFSSGNTTARLANSISSRKSFVASRSIGSRNSRHDSFNLSKVPSLPRVNITTGSADDSVLEHDLEDESKASVPDVYLPPPDDEQDGVEGDGLSLSDALQSVSRSNSPGPSIADAFEEDGTPKKSYDYSVSLKSESKRSPFDKFQNVAIRRGTNRTRTPSLTHTISSQTTSPTNSTPPSNRSFPLSRPYAASPSLAARVPLPRSRTASPVVRDGSSGNTSGNSDRNMGSMSSTSSMEITDVRNSSEVRADEEQETPEEGGSEEEWGAYNHGEEAPSAEGVEPTFSSDGAPTPYSNKSEGREQFTSPGSMAFTPTPAFPRPRARFNLPSPPDNEIPSTPAQNQDEVDDRVHDDLMTPHTRRRSFLLSVINSTARPRLKMGTPHPRYLATPSMASIAESTPGPSKGINSMENTTLRAAFVGVMPRPPINARRRISHPLSQAYVPSPSGSDTESLAAYDGDDRVSMISTTSSQDLTSHARANASFDPAMGFAAGGGGIGRFNAGKLNNYLHTLNRRLQEENELLLERMRKLEEEKYDQPSPIASESNRRLSAGSAGSRRLSAGTVLGDVEEDPAAERWLEEKAGLEEMVESFKEDVAKYMAEKEEAEDALENEKQERERDQERWKERMTEVEAGVSELVGQLEKKLDVAETKAREVAAKSEEKLGRFSQEIENLQAERDLADERAVKAERALESGRDLGGALNGANERLAQLAHELKNANGQIQKLEREVMEVEAHNHELEALHKKDQELILALEKDVNSTSDQLQAERSRVRELEDHIQASDAELREMKAYVEEVEENAEATGAQIESLENEIVGAQNVIKKLELNGLEAKQRITQLEGAASKAQDVNAQMEEALEEAENKMLEDNEAIANLRSELVALEREKQRIMVNASQSVSRSLDSTHSTDEEIEALEQELDDAHKDIARLNALLVQSPARKAMEMVKDARIEMLEKEKEELLERNKALRMTVNEITTPHKIVNASGISPIHRHVLSMSIRAPRTPGPPLRDLSWLNGTTHDPSVSPLIAEISRLHRELDRANESIDDKIDKLEDAGLGVVGLTQKLEDTRAQVIALEEEIARLQRTEERRNRRLERIRCQKCKVKVDIYQVMREDDSFLDTTRDYLPSEPPTPPTRTMEVLRQNLQTVNDELADLKKKWQEEKKQLVNEKAVLQDAANRLNAQVKEEAKRLAEMERKSEKKRLTVENELESARKTIQELEGELKSERSRLRNLDTQQKRIQRDRDELLNQLKRTESDMEDVRQHLHKFKQENNQLEKELRENATVEQKARLLEKKVAENQKTIESLRHERSSLATDFKKLQKRYTEASEHANKLRKEYTKSANSHEQRRNQLDIHLLEIEDLKRALRSQDSKVQQVEKEKERIVAEKNSVAETIAALENDLRHVRRDAETFGRDLKALKADKERAETRHRDEIAKLERAKKQTQAQLRLVSAELDSQKEQSAKWREEKRNHVCTADSRWLSALEVQHNKECKGLIVQIRYLKAKFTRESLFRDDLGYQKQYLLVLLSQFERGERRILASIARIGYPAAPPKSKKANKFKSVGFLIVFLSRARRASEAWQEHSASKQAIAAALQDVRRRRAAAIVS